MQALLRTRHPDVDVQPVHALPDRGDAGVFDEIEVALLLDDDEILGVRQRMRAGRGDAEPVLARDLLGRRAQRLYRREHFHSVARDRGVQLDHRGVQLRLEDAGQRRLGGALDEGRDLRRRHERFAVEDHDLLLDPQRERIALAEAVLDHRRIPCTGRPAASQA